MTDLFSLEGRSALITGGSRGIGRAIAVRLAADSAAVAINYSRNADHAEAAAAEVRSKGVAAENPTPLRQWSAVRSRFPDQRYARVSATMTPLRAISATRFGTAISPFAISANDQTAGSVATEPTITAATQSQR